jgi:hypothetical protein
MGVASGNPEKENDVAVVNDVAVAVTRGVGA